MILLALFTVALLLFFFLLKLQTKIDDKGIQMHYFPLSKKDIKWEQIESTAVIDYGFVGGWGIRYSSKYSTVYNTKGKMGVLIKLKDGGKFVIGTQRPEELKSFLDNR